MTPPARTLPAQMTIPVREPGRIIIVIAAILLVDMILKPATPTAPVLNVVRAAAVSIKELAVEVKYVPEEAG